MSNSLKQLKAIKNFLRDNWLLAIITLALLLIMLSVPTFQFIPYGFAKVSLGLLCACFGFQIIWTTFDKYFDSGEFVKDFVENTPAHYKVLTVAFSFAIIAHACIGAFN